MANVKVKAIELDNPELPKKEKKKISQRALVEARTIVGAKRTEIKISDKEWEAIQAGAISDTKMQEILANTDIDKLRERAMPRTTTGMTSAKIARAESMLDRGYTWEEVASSLGVSISTVQRALENK